LPVKTPITKYAKQQELSASQGNKEREKSHTALVKLWRAPVGGERS